MFLSAHECRETNLPSKIRYRSNITDDWTLWQSVCLFVLFLSYEADECVTTGNTGTVISLLTRRQLYMNILC